MNKIGVTLILAVFAQIATTPTYATITVVDSDYSLFVRTSSVQGFPLAVDSARNLYTVTGTSVSDSLVKIAPDGTSTVLNSAVGHVIGVGADLDFGFGGDLFANCGTGNSSSPRGIVRFDHVTGNASDFYTYPIGYGDGGLAFNQSSQTLFLTSEQDHALTAFNAAGQPTQVFPNVTTNAWGMDIESNGKLFVIDRGIGHIIQVDPVAQTGKGDITHFLGNGPFHFQTMSDVPFFIQLHSHSSCSRPACWPY